MTYENMFPHEYDIDFRRHMPLPKERREEGDRVEEIAISPPSPPPRNTFLSN